MVYTAFFTHSWRLGGAPERVPMREGRQKDGENRKRLRPAPEKVPALRRQSRASAHRPGHSVQRFRLVRHRLCRQVQYEGRRSGRAGFVREERIVRQQRGNRQGFAGEGLQGQEAGQKEVSKRSLELQRLEVSAKRFAKFLVLQRQLDGGLQEAELFAGIVGNTFVDVGPQALFSGKNLHGVGQLNLAAGTRFGSLQAAKNGRRKNVAPGNREIGRRVRRFWLLHQIADAQQSLAELALRSGVARHDSIKLRLLVRHFFHGDGA